MHNGGVGYEVLEENTIMMEIKSVLKWDPKVSFDQLVKGMLDSALEEEQAGHVIIKPFDWEAIGE